MEQQRKLPQALSRRAEALRGILLQDFAGINPGEIDDMVLPPVRGDEPEFVVL